MLRVSVSLAAAVLLLAAAQAEAKSLLLISIDGMNPQYVTEADKHGLKVPNLRRFLTEGSYARDGARGVTPTITCPSHATLVTGVTPSKHGVTGNDYLQPRGFVSGLCTFASDIKADTLWDAAARAGIDSGSVGWLNTAGTTSVRYNIPHVEPYDSTVTVKMQEAMSRPEGLLAGLEAQLGSYYQSPDETGSRTRTRFALEIMRRYKPGLMLFHIIAVDGASHRNGPFTDAAKRAVETEDALVGEVIAQALANDPDTVVAIVSDHGQAPATRQFNLRIPLVEAGLIKIAPPALGTPIRVTEKKVDVWGQAILLTDPADAAVKAQVAAVLHRLAADPANGIARVIEGEEVARLGGWPGASFVLDMRSGTVIGGAYIGEHIVTLPSTVGTHGYLPNNPQMNATFMIKGRGIRAGLDLGVIDMLQIAPTLAQALGVTLRDATATPLAVFTAGR